MDDREMLGRIVRETWVQWAHEQQAPKPSWLAGWDELDSGQREVDMRIGEAVANSVIGACETPKTVPGEGGWLRIAFMGHIEYTGYVTEVTKNGQPAYRIDLPEKVWGGNPLAFVTHAASSWFSDHPVTEESVLQAWQAQQERARERARMDAEWSRRQQQNALEAGGEITGECPETSDGQHTASWHAGGKCAACGQTGPHDDDDWDEGNPF